MKLSLIMLSKIAFLHIFSKIKMKIKMNKLPYQYSILDPYNYLKNGKHKIIA